jgi:hypothetical protein
MTFLYETFGLLSKQLKERKMTSIERCTLLGDLLIHILYLDKFQLREDRPHAAPLCATLFLAIQGTKD